MCPFTQEKKGQMQMVCIVSAINLNIEKLLVESETDDIKCVPGRIVNRGAITGRVASPLPVLPRFIICPRSDYGHP